MIPSPSQSFTSCCIGSAGHRTTTTAAATASHAPASHGPELVFPQHPVLARSQSVPATLGPHSWTPTQLPTEGVVATTAAGSQDMEWGSPTSLEGHLGSVAIFCEALQQAQVKALFCAGTSGWDMEDVPRVLVVTGGLSTMSQLTPVLSPRTKCHIPVHAGG